MAVIMSDHSKRMALVRSKDTKPELIVRKLVYSLGFRYRLHQKDLPGKPDIVFASRKKVIFVHGCFWHLHENCKRSRLPKSRVDYWRTKLEKNRLRDEKNQKELLDMGWKFLIIWECETHDRDLLRAKIIDFLSLDK